MQLLVQSQFSQVLPLFEPIETSLMVRSMALGNTPGKIWADDATRPRVALAWNGLDWLFLAGEPGSETAEEIRALLEGEVNPAARERWVPGIELFSYPPAWQAILERQVLAGMNPVRFEVLSFTLTDPHPAVPPPGFELRPINRETLSQTSLAHHDGLTGWVLSFWPTLEAFLSSGYGYCLVQGDAVAAWCLTVFSAGLEDELALETVERYRGQGLATVTASACIQHALGLGRHPHWHCNAGNLPSLSVARKAGYQVKGAIPAIRFETGKREA